MYRRIKEWVDQMQTELVTLADSATAGKSLNQVETIHTTYGAAKKLPYFLFQEHFGDAQITVNMCFI